MLVYHAQMDVRNNTADTHPTLLFQRAQTLKRINREGLDPTAAITVHTVCLLRSAEQGCQHCHIMFGVCMDHSGIAPARLPVGLGDAPIKPSHKAFPG